MLQVVYGWKGVRRADVEGEVVFRYVHLPQETFQNQYRPWDAGSDHPYVGEIHEDVDIYETVTTTTINGAAFMVSSTQATHCNVCGDWDREPNGD